MSAGDITYDADTPKASGNVYVATGTLEADNSLTGFAICSTQSTILTAAIVDKDGVGAARVVLNDSNGTATKGSISVDGENTGPETFYFRVEFI